MIIKPDWQKLKREIHATTALQRNVGDDAYLSDLALYATYLYCIASHFRGHIHMTHWNMIYPYKFEAGVTPMNSNPRLFTMKISNLDDQRLFIEIARTFILHRQEYLKKWKIQTVFSALSVDFTREVPIEDVALPASIESKE